MVVSWPKNDPASSKFSGFVLSSGHPRQCLTESAEQAALAMPHPAGAEEDAQGGQASHSPVCTLALGNSSGLSQLGTALMMPKKENIMWTHYQTN